MKEKLEERIKRIVREELNKLPANHLIESCQYQLDDLEELNEYMWIKPCVTGLGVDIFVDDGQSFVRHEHELLMFARNGYGRNCHSFIPFSVSSQPQVLDDNMDFAIPYDIIFSIQDFIQSNLNGLIALANTSISQEEFVDNINAIHSNLRFVSESQKFLLEMATLRVVDSHLPMDIWLDEGGTYIGHAPRIKFRASNEQRTTREFSSMLIANVLTIENMPENSPIRKRDIDKLFRFVVNNMENLLKLANGEIDYLTEFKPNMIIEDL